MTKTKGATRINWDLKGKQLRVLLHKMKTAEIAERLELSLTSVRSYMTREKIVNNFDHQENPLTKEDFVLIKELRKHGILTAEIADKFDVSVELIQRVLNDRESFSDVPQYKYTKR